MKTEQINPFFSPRQTGIKKTKATETAPADDDKKLRESAKQLEGLFIGFILKAMEKTIPKDDKQNSNNMVSMMFSSVMGRELAEQGGFGLSDYLYRAMAHGTKIPSLQKLNNSLSGDMRFNINMLENENE